MELAQLKNLHLLQISDCPTLKNLETLIEKCSSLTKVSTENYSFKPGFIERMRALRPNLVIEAVPTMPIR